MASKTALHTNSVLVIGAAGHIGLAVAQAFRRAGYFVYGVVRNPNVSATLLASEIIPVLVKDAHDIESYKKYIETAQVIVDCLNSFGDTDPADLPKKLIKAASEASSNRDKLLPQKIYIYCSGMMVYGNDTKIRDETSPISTKYYAKWRRDVEETLIQTPHLTSVVLRPGWIFGRYGDNTRAIFSDAPIVIAGNNEDRRYTWIHVDDVAEAFVAAAKKGVAVHGQVFNIVNNYDIPNRIELLLKGGEIAGHKREIKRKQIENWKEEIANDTVILHASKAIQLLDWHPKIFGLLDNLEYYYEVHKAGKALAIATGTDK